MPTPTPPPLSVVPSGDLSTAFAACATSLSQSAEFQTMCGVATAADALPFIDYPLRDVETYGFAVPGAIIIFDDALQYKRSRMGHRSGQLVVILVDEIDNTYYGDGIAIDYRNDAVAWWNRVGAIAMQLLGNANVFRVAEYRLVGEPGLLGPPDWVRADGLNRKFRNAALLLDWV